MTSSISSNKHISPFRAWADGEIAFDALKGFLDVRYSARDGPAFAEFSWEGHDENDPACGRGWVVFGTARSLIGHFYIHNGDDSGFVCERAWLLQQPARACSDGPAQRAETTRQSMTRVFPLPAVTAQ
jgi:hypothetical protein